MATEVWRVGAGKNANAGGVHLPDVPSRLVDVESREIRCERVVRPRSDLHQLLMLCGSQIRGETRVCRQL